MLAGAIIIELLGHTYTTVNIGPPGWGPHRETTGFTAMYWIGGWTIGRGIAVFVAGIILFLLNHPE